MSGTIDQLNFEVIISDKKFDAQIKDIENKARQFNTSLSNILNIRKISTQMSQKDVENARRVQQAKVDEQRAQEKINREKIKTEGLQRKINAQIERATKGYNQQSRILNELKGYALGYLSIHGASQLLSSLVRVTGEFELQKTTLSAMLGDLNKAEQVITKIQGLAVESPFQFKELTTYAKQLSAFSVPAQELYDTTKMLADISAGLGVGMDRIVLAYGQVRSAAFLRGQEVRQFTEAGIPILDELAKQFSELEGRAVSAGEVFDKISARLVPFEMVAKVFKDMTSEGGKFFNMQEVQAETLRGKISNLKDAYEVMLNEIGQEQSDKLKGAVDWARNLMTNYESIGRLLIELVSAYGIYRAALLATDVATKVFLGTNQGLFLVLNKAKIALLANPYTALAAALTAVGLVVYKTATSLESYEKIQKSVVESENKFTRNLTKETTKLDALYAKLNLAKEGTQEYAEAKKQIYSQYAGYISELQAEGVAVDNLTTVYGKLKEKIEQSAEARFRVTAARNLENTYDTEMDKMFEKYERLTKNIERFLDRTLSATEKEGLWQYLLGNDQLLKDTPELHGLQNAIKDYMDRGTGVSIQWLKKQIGKIISEYEEGKKKIDALFGVDVPEQPTTSPTINLGGDEDGDSPTKKIQEEIAAVKRLRDAYDTLAPYMNGEMLKKTLTALFPNADQQLIQSLDFRGKLVALAAQLNEFDKDASKELLDSIGGEKAGEIASAFKAIETYKNMLDSWLGEDFTLTGEGVTFDISKILRDLNNQYAKINQKAIQASDLLTKAQMGDEAALATVREVYGEEVWQKYLLNGKATIEELARLEREEAKNTADEKIRDLSNKYVKEKMAKGNINLTDFEDKTLSQISEMIHRLNLIRAKIEEDIFMLEWDGVSEEEKAQLDMLKSAIEQLGVIIDDTNEERLKKQFDIVRDGVKTISELGDEISSLGEAVGSFEISRLGDELSRTAGTFANLMDAIAANDPISLVSNIVSYVIEGIATVVSNAYEHQRKLNEAAKEYRDIMLDVRRESYSGMFGTNELALAAENAKILAEEQKRYEDVLKKVQNVKWQGFGGSFYRKDSIENALQDAANAQGWDLYLENGELNLDAIEAHFDAYSSRLTRKQRDLVQDLIDSGRALEDAAAQQAAYLIDIFSGAADDIASSMVEAFIEGGDAAIDMREAVSDVASRMATDLIKTLYVMPILTKYAEQLNEIANNDQLSQSDKTAQSLEVFQTALEELEGNRDAINDTLEKLDEYFLHPEQDESGTGLGNGIKGITEDTANLLASYLNAIRADVSFSKTLWIRMDANLQRMAEMAAMSPTLMEYQAQIAANTFNAAEASRSILSELRSVLNYSGGQKSIRVS